MKQFAEDGQKSLLIIVDQVHKNLSYFETLKAVIQSFTQMGIDEGHVAVLSSSTSGDVSPVFGKVCEHLESFNKPVTPDELKLLISQHGSTNKGILEKESLSFLQTIWLLEAKAPRLMSWPKPNYSPTNR